MNGKGYFAMKKIYALISVLLSVVLLSSCGSKTSDIESEDDSGSMEATEQII